MGENHLKPSLYAADLDLAHARFIAVSNLTGHRLNSHQSPRQICSEIENAVSEWPHESESKLRCHALRLF